METLRNKSQESFSHSAIERTYFHGLLQTSDVTMFLPTQSFCLGTWEHTPAKQTRDLINVNSLLFFMETTNLLMNYDKHHSLHCSTETYFFYFAAEYSWRFACCLQLGWFPVRYATPEECNTFGTWHILTVIRTVIFPQIGLQGFCLM